MSKKLISPEESMTDILNYWDKIFNHPVELQTFKTSWPPGCSKEKLIKVHRYEIMKSVLYSKKTKYPTIIPGKLFYVMSGFKEITGHSPVEGDMIEFIRGHYWFTILPDRSAIISEVGFHITKLATPETINEPNA